MKKLLVVGAGPVQADGIRLAREMGYTVFATDGSPDAPGLALADDSAVLDVRDVQGHVRLATELGIDGVISYATDICLPTVLAVKEALGLPGLGATPMRISLNKAEQRERFRAKGIPQPRFCVVQNHAAACDAARGMGGAVVIKPADSSGSRGVTLVRREAEIEEAVRLAFSFTEMGLVLVEEFVEGTELTVEGFSLGGKHYINAISDKFKPETTPTSTTEQVYPAPLTREQRQSVIEYLQAVYDAAEVDNTPTHTEVILTDNGPKLVEMACRGCGFYVFTRITQKVGGYDAAGNWTRYCAGDSVETPGPYREVMGSDLRFLVGPPGKLLRIEGLDEVRETPGLEFGLFYEPGDIIPAHVDDGSRTGWLIAEGVDRAAAMNKAKEAAETIKFFTEVGHD